MKTLKTIALLLAVTLMGSMSAMAQPKHLEPGSVMVYPLFDSAPGAGTVICVTNLNTDVNYCEDDDNRAGDVALHYQYIADGTWQEFDRYEFLTPGDTLCLLADKHNPEGERGFLVVSAVDPVSTDDAIDFDHLIGSAIIVQSDLNFLWTYTPYAFEGNPANGNPNACDRDATDDDNDGALDFDGTEYNLFPNALYVDSFFEESDNFENSLVLMTTTGASYVAHVDFLFWNNIEQKFSRSFNFTCWWNGSLSDVSNIAEGLGGDDEEFPVQTGWVSMVGNRVTDLAGNPVPDSDDNTAIPPILGVFSQSISARDFSAGHALHFDGTLDGLELLVGDQDPQDN